MSGIYTFESQTPLFYEDVLYDLLANNNEMRIGNVQQIINEQQRILNETIRVQAIFDTFLLLIGYNLSR